MRTLTWCLGMIVLAAWHSVLAELGRRAPGIWWAYLLSWIFLGLAGAAGSAVWWAIGKYKAGALEATRLAGTGAPAGLSQSDIDSLERGSAEWRAAHPKKGSD